MALAARPVALALLSGCSLITDSFATNDFSGDEFPIQVDTSSGAVLLGVRQSNGVERVAVLDVLAPLTWVDPGPAAAPSVETQSLLLLGQTTPGGPADQPRAFLDSKQVVSNHPCLTDPCVVGPVATPAPYGAIIGADALAGDAVRLRLGADQIFVLADIGGSEEDRTRACDGVFPSPYRGGGTLFIGGTELGFGGRRIALATCLGANPDPSLPQGYRGADTLFVMSTSIGPSLMGESAYRRYFDSHPPCDPLVDPTCPPVLETLPTDTVNLPSGPVEGRRGTIPNLALVAAASPSRAACRQVYASHFMLQRNCNTDDDCPCDNPSEPFCSTPAILELAPAAGIEILVVPDDNKSLQALRTELRPNQAEVDGILGSDALRAAEIDVDYPHNRMLVRCTADGCITRPELPEASDRPRNRDCLAGTPPGPVF